MSGANNPITLYPADDLIVWKGSDSNDLSNLVPGDRLYAGGRVESSGKLMVNRIWANITNFFGLVFNVLGNGYQVAPSGPKANFQTAAVTWRSDTVINENTVSIADMKPGMFAQTIGVIGGDGTVQATRVWIYDQFRSPINRQGRPVLSPFAKLR